MALLMGGALLYARFVPARRRGNVWLWVFVFTLGAIEIYNQFGAAPTNPRAMALTALTAYLMLAFFAALVDRTRLPADVSTTQAHSQR